MRKMRQEISHLREANLDLKDGLHEARQEFLYVKEERDYLKKKLNECNRDLGNVEGLIQNRVAKALEASNIELKKQIEVYEV